MTSVAYDTHGEWLAARRLPCDDGMVPIHASEVAEILFGEPLNVYALKLGHEIEDSYLLRRGRRMEGVIAEEYAEQTGRPVRDLGAFTVQQHASVMWLRATLDRVTTQRRTWNCGDPWIDIEARAPLQIKLALGSAHEWRDGPPMRYEVQVQFEIACYGSAWGSLCGMIGPGPLAVHDLERDDELVALAIPKLQEFRERVRDGIPPEPRSSAALDVAKRLWAGSGDTITLADPSVLDLVAAWERARSIMDSAEEWRQESDARIRVLMTDASAAWLPDGSLLTRRKRGRGESIVREFPRRTR